MEKQQQNSTGFPQLKTERLVLREMSQNDLPELLVLRSDLQVSKYLDRPPTITEERAIIFINKIAESVGNHDSYYWVIAPSETNKMIGTICIWNIDYKRKYAEVGFELLPAFQRKGIMREALTTVLKYGFDILCFKTLFAYTLPENAASVKLVEKNGFILDRRYRKNAAKEIKFALTALAYNLSKKYYPLSPDYNQDEERALGKGVT